MIKKNIPIAVGIAIPVLMILFVAGSIYLPGLFAKPKYNFLYVTGEYYGRTYTVANGQVVQNYVTSTYALAQPQPQLFVYDTARNQSQPISFEDAQKLSLDPDEQSVDGFSVVSGGSEGGGFPFFMGSSYDYNAHYLTGHDFSKKINIRSSSSDYYNNFTFLGWINN